MNTYPKYPTLVEAHLKTQYYFLQLPLFPPCSLYTYRKNINTTLLRVKMRPIQFIYSFLLATVMALPTELPRDDDRIQLLKERPVRNAPPFEGEGLT